MDGTMSSKHDQFDLSGLQEQGKTDWKGHAEKLLKKLDELRLERSRYEDTLKRLVSTHEIASEEVEKQKREIAYRDDDIKYLWDEIYARQHGNENVERIKVFREKQVNQLQVQRDNLDRKIGYLEAVIRRQDAIVRRLEQENALRVNHFKKIKETLGWKILRALGGKTFRKPVDLSSLEPVPEEVHEPEATPLPDIGESPKATDYKRTFKRDESIARDYRAVLESPRSFASKAVGQKVRFTGWCCDKAGKPANRIWAKVGDQEIPCATGVIRNDVVQSVSDLEIDPRCGFQGEITTGPGENFIEIHGEFPGGSKALMFKRIVVNLGFERTPKRQLDEDYQSWIQCFDTPSASDIRKMEQDVETFAEKPLISVLLPVYDTPEKWLSQVIESVRNQIYPHWELCIADDLSPSPHVKEILDRYAALDTRIKVVYREKNGHISAATNSGLEVATGSFCALLDHDDLLPIHALYHIAKELNAYPEADLLFSDEDKIDSHGTRFDPYFKSDWNPDLFLSHNCISHLGVYRTSILREINGFDEALYGSQDWDMALRFMLKTTPEKIRHIPRILYHWRYLDTSTSKSIDSKPYAVTAGKKAIENYLESCGRKAVVQQGMWPGAYRVVYRLEQPVDVSIVIPTRDQYEVTRRCIDSILAKTTYANFEIVLMDNQSSEPQTLKYFDSLKGNDRVRVVKYDHPFNFSAINNAAAKEAKGEVIVFLNNDMEVVEPGWLEELASQAMRPEVGAVGGWLLFPDHTVQHAGIVMGVCGIAVEAFKHQLEWNIGHMGRAHLNQYYSAVTGACLATRKQVFLDQGGFNEQQLTVAYNDVDYCLRLRRDAGLATVWTPYAKLLHHESTSRGYEVTEEQKQRFAKESAYMTETWAEVIERDPYYNPNLTRYDTQFNLAWPPRVEAISGN